MSHQLVQAGDWDQLIPIHPANTPDTLVTRPANAPAQEAVMLSTVQANQGLDAGPVDCASCIDKRMLRHA